MDRYQRVEKPREETAIKENEIRITTQGRMRNYITYATALLQGIARRASGIIQLQYDQCKSLICAGCCSPINIGRIARSDDSVVKKVAKWFIYQNDSLATFYNDKGSDEVVFKAMGGAINKSVMIAELIKRRIVGLHQNTTTGSIDITDTWELLEEGLLPLETTRHVSMITITFSKKELDTSSVGYQFPLPAEEVKPLVDYETDEDVHSPAGRGRGRGGRGNGYNDYADGGWEDDHASTCMDKGYGRGRRGGYGCQPDYNQDGGYYDEAPIPAPTRGRGRLGRGRGPTRGRGRGGDTNGVMHVAVASA